MNRTAWFATMLLLFATGCTSMQPELATESAQSLAENRRAGDWRLIPAWTGSLNASQRSGIYKTFAKVAPKERILFDGLKVTDNEAWLGYIRKSGLFRREITPQCRLVRELPEAEKIWICGELENLISLLGAPTHPASKPWGEDRKCISTEWRLFSFDDDGRIRILTISAIVSRNAYETAWRVEGLLLREGVAMPAGFAGADMPQ